MPSVFAFYRARGVAGCYVVGIQLDLRPTETAEVRFGGNLQVQHPMRKIHADGTRELYRIDQVTLGHAISIQIHDSQLLPYQLTMYQATLDGFTIQHIPYKDSRMHPAYDFGVISLNHITLIDCDKEDVVIQQEDRIVDAVPVTALPQPKRKRTPKVVQAPGVSHDNHSGQLSDIDHSAFTF